jgi:hypothetical protein
MVKITRAAQSRGSRWPARVRDNHGTYLLDLSFPSPSADDARNQTFGAGLSLSACGSVPYPSQSETPAGWKAQVVPQSTAIRGFSGNDFNP